MCAEKFDYIFQFGKAAKEEKTMQVSEVASLISHTLYYRRFFCFVFYVILFKVQKIARYHRTIFIGHFFCITQCSGIKLKLLVFIL